MVENSAVRGIGIILENAGRVVWCTKLGLQWRTPDQRNGLPGRNDRETVDRDAYRARVSYWYSKRGKHEMVSRNAMVA